MNFKRIASRVTASLLLAAVMVSPTLAATGTVNTEGSSLRLRSQASTESSVLTKLPHGTQVDVLDQSVEGWYQVSYKGTEGYVSADYLIVSEGDDTVADAPAPASAAPTDELAEVMYIKVLQGPLNIRTGPSTDYDRVGQLSVGRTAEVLDVLDGWYQIESGYVCEIGRAHV